jgi:predicted TIM-barrel fold metal-dependent hydrolase
MRRCAAAGAPGFGELRPENLGFDLTGEDGKRLGRLAADLNVILLFHASEPVGHAYPGKRGLELSALYEFILEHPGVKVVAAHWGGGLGFYALMPEVRLALQNTYLDTAGTSLLYAPEIYELASTILGAGRVLFGSDFPLLDQRRSRERIEQANLAPETQKAILGDNAAALLDIR